MKKLGILLCTAVLIIASFTACGNTPVSRGTVSGATYESAFLGLGFSLPDGFTFATDEQIAEQYNTTLDESQLESAPVIYDMFASDETGNSVAISIEKISLMSEPVSSSKEHLQNLSDAMGLQLEQMSFSDIQVELTTVALAEQETDALVIRANFSGMAFYQTYLCEKRGGYLATVSILAMDEILYSSLLNRFYRPETTLA